MPPAVRPLGPVGLPGPLSPTDEVIEHVKNRDRKKAKDCKNKVQKAYGVRPRDLFRYIDRSSKKAVVQAVLDNWSNLLSPEFLYTVALEEGLAQYLTGGGWSGKKKVLGYWQLGLDTFGSHVTELKRQGFLRDDFTRGIDYKPKTETISPGEFHAGQKVKSATFPNLRPAMEALAADLTSRCSQFLEDAKSIFEEDEIAKLSQEQIEYWTYWYYNMQIHKPEEVRKRLKESKTLKIRKWTGDPEGAGRGYSTNAHSNALIRMATAAYLRCTGIFPMIDIPSFTFEPTPELRPFESLAHLAPPPPTVYATQTDAPKKESK